MAFEVASVKPAKPGVPRKSPWTRTIYDRGDAKPPGGSFSASLPLGFYIFFAYKLAAFEAMDMQAQLPKWANDAYAIDAKAEGIPRRIRCRLMMQSLLADRFKLRAHFETKEVPVVALTLVKPGKLGPKLLPHSEGPPCPDSFDDNPFPAFPAPKPGVGVAAAMRNFCPNRNAGGYLARVAECDHGVACQRYLQSSVRDR
jgi:uncharacterized protein (TIGR03435 family)